MNERAVSPRCAHFFPAAAVCNWDVRAVAMPNTFTPGVLRASGPFDIMFGCGVRTVIIRHRRANHKTVDGGCCWFSLVVCLTFLACIFLQRSCGRRAYVAGETLTLWRVLCHRYIPSCSALFPFFSPFLMWRYKRKGI